MNNNEEQKLFDKIHGFKYDPLGFVRYAFPWGEKGTILENASIDHVETEILSTLGKSCQDNINTRNAIQMAVASGNGIGKSSIAAWVIIWFMSTRETPQIVVTANTKTQLETKTWRELSKWHKMAINKRWFTWTATKFYAVDSPSNWFAAAIPQNENNPEAFSGTHEKNVLTLVDEACHDNKTEVMTDNGWKLFSNLEDNDKLLTQNPETGESFYVKPTHLYNSHYNGDMYEYKNRGANFCVTPTHNMWYQIYRPKHSGSKYYGKGYTEWGLGEIKDLVMDSFYISKTIKKWIGNNLQYFTIPSFQSERKKWGSIDIPMNEWMEFLGWYYSEGSITCYSKTIPYQVRITNCDKNILLHLSEIVSGWGLNISLYKHTKNEYYKQGYDFAIRHRPLAEYLYKYGSNCLNKRLTEEIRNATSEQQKIFLKSFRLGDGYIKGKREILYTSNEKLAGDLQEIALKSGYTCTVVKRKLADEIINFKTHTAKSTVDGCVVALSLNHHRSCIRTKNIKKICYNGMVYCAEVEPYHLLFTKRNGNPMWSGNSAVPDVIWEMNDGSMTTPGAMRLVCGNPTKNTGRFFECFNRFKSRWITKQIDSRDSTLTNKEELQNWIDDYGEDSDYVRVHVKGIFPRFSMNQLISEEMVNRAIKRDNKPEEYRYEPIILGVDVARMGDDQSVICVRQGNKVHELRKFRGLDGPQVANEVLIVEREYHRLARDIFIFLDVVGIGASAYDALVRLSKSNVFPVNAGIKASDSKRFFNKRIEMWWDMKEWLDLVGQIPDDKELTIDLTAPTYGYANKTEQFQLEGKKEMKGRGLASPDSGDSLAHTFFIKISLDNYNSIDYSDDDEYGYNDNNRTSTPYTGY